MLATLGFAMIATFMVLIMTRTISAIAALILVPIVFGLLAGHGADMTGMALEGIIALAPTAAALVFAVLYFCIMMDAGLFDPLVRSAVKFAHGDPLRVSLATAAVATLVSLDGDGATTAIITIGAFLPIYRRLGMNPLMLAVLLGSANSTINLTPWGGPTARVASALNVDIMDVFLPLLPTMIAAIIGVFVLALVFGLWERKRLGIVQLETDLSQSLFDREPGVERPKLFWVNLALTLALLGCVVGQVLPLPIAFMIGLTLACIINYPKLSDQRERVAAHASNVVPIVLLIFSAGVFTGILEGTGMIAAMGETLLALVPAEYGPHFGPIIALASAPFTFVLSNEAYYFGIVPVLAETAQHFGVEPVEVARASLLGVNVHALSPLVAPIYLVATLLKVEVGDLQRFGLPFAILFFLLMVAVSLATGAVPFVVH
ncbi:CitMHS family transporter [Vitreimonas flagellata]|uniref:CitMHS family transporter n=1 Tax=Vitreimonas flagellata TaxID=2560861 RepID=UPI00107566CC|nr:citrate:proton symporter [Vitreimonas flagellata]